MSVTSLARREQPGQLAINYSSDQLQLIKDTYAKGASDAEFRLFVEVSKYQGLDIFKKQIYLMKFWDSDKGGWGFQPVTGIDGYRAKAEDTGVYGGQLGPFWCGEDGLWKDVWTSNKPPTAAKVGVIRTDWKEPIWAVARYASYVQTKKDGTPNKMWEKMADNQLAKCAESLALRKAFPQQVGALYTDVEMEQSASEPGPQNVRREYPDIKPVEPLNFDISERERLKAEFALLWPKTQPPTGFGPYFEKRFRDVPNDVIAQSLEQAKAEGAKKMKAAQEKHEAEAAGQVVEGEVVESGALIEIGRHLKTLEQWMPVDKISSFLMRLTQGEELESCGEVQLQQVASLLRNEIAEFSQGAK